MYASTWTSPRGAGHCGSYAIYATVERSTVPLATCAGLGGSRTLQHVTLRRGEAATLSFEFGKPHITADRPQVVAIEGLKIVGQRTGAAVITAHGTVCVAVLTSGVQPRSCPVVVVTVR